MKLGNKNDTVKVEVILGRRLIGTFMTIYMPTILLNIIGHSTNYFKPFFFEAVVTVNLTVKSWDRIWISLLTWFPLWIRSCWSSQRCLLEWARVCQRQAASRWWTIGSCLISSFLLWRFWSTLTRWDIVFIDPIRTASASRTRWGGKRLRWTTTGAPSPSAGRRTRSPRWRPGWRSPWRVPHHTTIWCLSGRMFRWRWQLKLEL